LYPLREPFLKRGPDRPPPHFSGGMVGRGAECGLARAEEGSGEESARASACFFGEIFGASHIVNYITLLL